MIYLETPLTVDKIKQLKAGDEVFLSGTIYTGRDAAHKRFFMLAQHLQNQVKYLAVVDQPLQEEWMLIHLDLLNLAYMR